MYITIDTATEFRNQFDKMGRGSQFSWEAMEALFDYYNDFDEFELDVIAICCEWTEYDSIEAALEEYQLEDIDELQDRTYVIELSNGHVLVQAY